MGGRVPPLAGYQTEVRAFLAAVGCGVSQHLPHLQEPPLPMLLDTCSPPTSPTYDRTADEQVHGAGRAPALTPTTTDKAKVQSQVRA